MNEQSSTEAVRQTILARRGELARLAGRLKVTPTTVSLVLSGKTTSRRILKAAIKRAEKLTSLQTLRIDED